MQCSDIVDGHGECSIAEEVLVAVSDELKFS